jgi:hypothetical protein
MHKKFIADILCCMAIKTPFKKNRIALNVQLDVQADRWRTPPELGLEPTRSASPISRNDKGSVKT